MEPHGAHERPEPPGPSLWPVGFAIGIVCILVGLVVSWPAVAVGAVIALVFGFLWIRDVTGEYRAPPARVDEGPAPSSAAAPLPAQYGGEAMPPTDEEELERRFPRSVFLELSTLGIGGVITGIVSLPIIGFAILPAFEEQAPSEGVDLGPLDNFPEGQWREATFLSDPAIGEVSRRTAYVRNNGAADGKASFTIISNRCVHLGCPVQASGPRQDADTEQLRTETAGELRITPISPANFSCPCHGGAYDTEGNRVSGPPVRSLDRYKFSIIDGRLVLGQTYSVGDVRGEGADAQIEAYGLQGPGEHVDGLEAWLYPLQPEDLR